jgi:uncharacterized protein YgiM (DUF1202 family)
MNHDVKLKTRTPRFGVFHALLMAVALLAVGLNAPHTLAVTDNTPETAPAGVAASPAPVSVRKIVCHAHTITVRWSPGRNGRIRGELGRGELFTVLNKHDNVWFYGISNRGMTGWVLAEYLCDLP